MSKEMISRLRKAGGYQRQAIRALLPEGMEGHLDVIENEIKKMFEETVTGIIVECRDDAAKKESDDMTSDRGIRKVFID